MRAEFSPVYVIATLLVPTRRCGKRIAKEVRATKRNRAGSRLGTKERPDTFNDKQSQIAERKTGNGRGPGNHSREAV